MIFENSKSMIWTLFAGVRQCKVCKLALMLTFYCYVVQRVSQCKVWRGDWLRCLLFTKSVGWCQSMQGLQIGLDVNFLQREVVSTAESVTPN